MSDLRWTVRDIDPDEDIPEPGQWPEDEFDPSDDPDPSDGEEGESDATQK